MWSPPWPYFYQATNAGVQILHFPWHLLPLPLVKRPSPPEDARVSAVSCSIPPPHPLAIRAHLEIWSYQSPMSPPNVPVDRCPRACTVLEVTEPVNSLLWAFLGKRNQRPCVKPHTQVKPSACCSLPSFSLFLFYFPHFKGEQKSLGLMWKHNEAVWLQTPTPSLRLLATSVMRKEEPGSKMGGNLPLVGEATERPGMG